MFNNVLQVTLPALANFDIIARYTGLGGGVSLNPAAHGAGGPPENER